MSNELYNKMLNEEPLTAAEEQVITAWLESGQGAMLSEIVHELPAEAEPSMAWRSELNEKLRASRPVAKPAKTRVWRWVPIFGALAAAASLSIMSIRAPAGSDLTATPSVSFEAALVQDHVNSVNVIELNGGLKMDTLAKSQPVNDKIEWSTSELESL